MINLKTRKTHTIADNDTIESILGDAFKQTVDTFVATEDALTTISREDLREDSLDITRLLIECYERQLDYYQSGFHNELKNQLAKRLELTNDEYIEFGEIKHAHGINIFEDF